MFKFRKIASVLASTFMIGSSIAVAAAANFPEPFVKGGNADVAVVWGSAAGASLDLAAVTNIADKLSSEYAKQGIGGGSTTVTGGDSVLLAKSSDKLNLGNTLSGVFGTTVTKDHLKTLLADGTYSNKANTDSDYEQKITLGPYLNVTAFADSDYKSKEPTVGIRLNSNTLVMNYTLDVIPDAESDVGSSGDLTDFETTTIKILGKDYYILDAKNSSSSNTITGKFTLLDSADTVLVTDGENKVATIGGKSYDISLAYISATAVKVTVNGETSTSLASGGTYKLKDGTFIGVKEILYNAKDTGISKAELSIGSGKLEIDPTNEIKLNDDTVSNVRGYIYGSMNGAKRRLDKITIEWKTDDKVFIAPGEDLVMPGFGALKFSMGSFVVPAQEKVTVDYDGDDKVRLNIPIKSGDASIPLLYSDTTGSGSFLGMGKASDERLATSSGNVLQFNQSTSDTANYHKYFVATYNTSTDAESYLLEAFITKDTNTGLNRTRIRNTVTGEDLCTNKANSDTCDFGSVSLTFSNTTYTAAGAKSVSISGGSNVNFNTVFSKTGLKVFLPYEAANTSTAFGAINFTPYSSTANGHNNLSFDVTFREEDKDGTLGAGNTNPAATPAFFNVTVDDTGASTYDTTVSAIDTGAPVSAFSLPADTSSTTAWVWSDLATKVTKLVSGSRAKAEIEYAGSSSYAEVYLAAPSASVSGSGNATLGSITVKDSEVTSVSGKNLIVVGGSCVNTVAQSLLGAAAPLCGADWTAKTGIEANQALIQVFASPYSSGKIATLVAGFNAQDTAMAGKYLTTQTVDMTAGKKWTVTSETAATVSA